ncbi:MAG TPA: hypothetical protein VF791_04425 [Pyrinomonadaceae bacterium]
MEKTLKAINRMVADGVIEQYSIGRAVAAIYYLEPFDTANLDIFVVLRAADEGLMLLTPIYDYLSRQGFSTEGELVDLEGLPVQILPVFNPLTEEAVRKAHQIKFGRTVTRVMRAEHLLAIMLDTGRPKDYARIAMFLEQKAVNRRALASVLKRHGLARKWEENQHRFHP